MSRKWLRPYHCPINMALTTAIQYSEFFTGYIMNFVCLFAYRDKCVRCGPEKKSPKRCWRSCWCLLCVSCPTIYSCCGSTTTPIPRRSITYSGTCYASSASACATATRASTPLRSTWLAARSANTLTGNCSGGTSSRRA